MIEGIDVSNWQGNIDWRQVRQAGKQFAFIKATQGINIYDGWFPHNWQGSLSNGIARIAYHFFVPGIDAIAQADYFHEYVRNNGRFKYGDACMLDLEWSLQVNPQTILEEAALFVQHCKKYIDKPVIIYTSPDYWNNQLGAPLNPVLARCPLYLADWGPSVPILDNWPHGLTFWQYASNGHCPGIFAETDLDRFFGDKHQLHEIMTVIG